MSDVFVSYKAEDRSRVRLIVDALQSDGLSVWWDADIGAGDRWRDTIAARLDEARCVLVVWSKRSVGPEGHFVRDEAARALKRGAYLPVCIDKVDPPLGFGESQALPLQGWKGDRRDTRYAALLAGAQSIAAVARNGTRPSTPPLAGVSRRAVVGGGVGVLAVLGAGGWYWFGRDGASSDSIAVLPFANLSGDPAQSYFSDGIAEEVRNALSRISNLKVVARTSSEILRNADAKSAARQLHVANILTGSVRRSVSTIRVSAQLVGGQDGVELWSQTFDRPFGDVLQIQSGIATSVAEALSIRLGVKDRSSLSLGGTRNPAAQDLLLKALPGGTPDSETGLLHALSLIEAAITLDPNYAEAYARRAFALNFYSGIFAHNSADAHARQTEAIASARRALAIEPHLALGYAALGGIFQNQLNLRAADQAFRQALTQPGTDVRALASYSTLLSQFGRTSDALRLIDQAIERDPLDPVSREVRTMTLYRARRYPEAIDYARQTLRTFPERPGLKGLLGLSMYVSGDFEQARGVFDQLPADNIRRLTGNAFLAIHRGDRGTAERYRAAIAARYGDGAHYQYAQIDAQLGNKDQAFSELEQAWEQRDAGLASLKVDPFLDPLRSDPRFSVVVASLKFP
ncbi:MAG: TIR domain-containing protein [Sphingomicrobium sp.]